MDTTLVAVGDDIFGDDRLDADELRDLLTPLGKPVRLAVVVVFTVDAGGTPSLSVDAGETARLTDEVDGTVSVLVFCVD